MNLPSKSPPDDSSLEISYIKQATGLGAGIDVMDRTSSQINMNPLINEVVQKIAEAIQPTKIILFGSQVYGGANTTSDIDLAIIYSGPKPKRELKVEIHKLFEHPEFSMDLFVLTPEELESQKHIANTLAREISEKGVVCYG